MLAAGRQHETDRERRRQDQLMKEGRELTFTPELNPNSRSLVERSAAHDDPIEVRMVRHVRNMAAKRASAIAAQQLEEANSMPTFKPEINRNVAVRQTGDVATRSVPAFVCDACPRYSYSRWCRGCVGGNRSKQWAENRQRKAEQLKSQLQQREQSELKYRPQLNPHSVKIANQDSRRRQGDVADHLYAQAERQRIERLERQEQKLADEVLGYPAITRQAAVLVRDQDIADRLYACHARCTARWCTHWLTLLVWRPSLQVQPRCGVEATAGSRHRGCGQGAEEEDGQDRHVEER